MCHLILKLSSSDILELYVLITQVLILVLLENVSRAHFRCRELCRLSEIRDCRILTGRIKVRGSRSLACINGELYGVRVNGRLNYAFAPLLARVSRLISYLYIPSGRELVSMIKKVPGRRRRKFRAEYLTLNESELCLGNGRRAEEGRKRGGGDEDRDREKCKIGSARAI